MFVIFINRWIVATFCVGTGRIFTSVEAGRKPTHNSFSKRFSFFMRWYRYSSTIAFLNIRIIFIYINTFDKQWHSKCRCLGGYKWQSSALYKSLKSLSGITFFVRWFRYSSTIAFLNISIILIYYIYPFYKQWHSMCWWCLGGQSSAL